MRREYSLSGIGFGLFLIALGVAAFSDIAAKTQLLGIIWRCYPVLPILLGLDLILPKVTPVSNSITLVRPAGWIFTLTILITILGFFSGVVPGLFQQEFKHLGFESFTPRLPLESGRNYRRTLQEDFTLPPGISTIRIENEFGDLRVDSGVSNVVSASARIKYAFQPPKSEADSQQVKWSGRVQGNIFVVHLEHPKFENKFLPQFMAMMVVKVPPGLAVELKNSFGQLKVSEIQGNLTVDNSNGQIRIGKVTGDTSITNRLSKLTIDSVGGNLTVESSAGQVNITQVAKNLSIHQDFGELNIGDINGDLTITAKNSSVTIHHAGGNIQLENSFGSVDIKEALNAVTAEVSNGSLRVEMNQIQSPVSLSAAFGSIELEVPKNAAFSLQATAAFGSIDTNFPVTRTQDTGGQSVTGDIHGGGPLVKLDARNGSIKIKD